MVKSPRVAIIGGGIGGLTAALAMHRRGVDVRVYEQAPTISEIGAGISLGPNGVKALRSLGLESRIRSVGFESEGQDLRAWDTGAVISHVHRKGVYEREFDAPYVSIHRADLLEILRGELPDSVFNLNKRCVEVSDGDAEATAVFADGSRATADVVVGADGIHSVVRKAVAGERAARFTGSVCWRGLVPYDSLPAGTVSKDLTIFMGPRSHVIHYMVRRGELVNFVAHVETDSWTGESWTQECDRSEVMDTFAGWHEPLRRLVGSSEHYYKWALFDRDPLDSWSRGRLTLLGDAAHPMLPHIGQGAVMSIEDGCVLGAMIDAFRHDPREAIARYQNLRMARANRAVIESRERGKEMHAQSRFSQMTRNLRLGVRQKMGVDKTGLNLGPFYDYDVATVCRDALKGVDQRRGVPGAA